MSQNASFGQEKKLCMSRFPIHIHPFIQNVQKLKIEFASSYRCYDGPYGPSSVPTQLCCVSETKIEFSSKSRTKIQMSDEVTKLRMKKRTKTKNKLDYMYFVKLKLSVSKALWRTKKHLWFFNHKVAILLDKIENRQSGLLIKNYDWWVVKRTLDRTILTNSLQKKHSNERYKTSSICRTQDILR